MNRCDYRWNRVLFGTRYDRAGVNSFPVLSHILGKFLITLSTKLFKFLLFLFFEFVKTILSPFVELLKSLLLLGIHIHEAQEKE